jgi:thiol-disulfide isomerase/thioredoxin
MPRLASSLLALALATACSAKEQTPPPGDIGARLALNTLDGKPALVVFWRPSCPHCVAELPDVVRVARDKDANSVTVMVAGSREAAKKVLTNAQFAGTALVDDGALATSLNIKAVPYTLVLRPDGSAAHAFLGRQSYDTLANAIASAQ